MRSGYKVKMDPYDLDDLSAHLELIHGLYDRDNAAIAEALMQLGNEDAIHVAEHGEGHKVPTGDKDGNPPPGHEGVYVPHHHEGEMCYIDVPVPAELFDDYKGP
jgi:hypothetical protein